MHQNSSKVQSPRVTLQPEKCWVSGRLLSSHTVGQDEVTGEYMSTSWRAARPKPIPITVILGRHLTLYFRPLLRQMGQSYLDWLK